MVYGLGFRDFVVVRYTVLDFVMLSACLHACMQAGWVVGWLVGWLVGW